MRIINSPFVTRDVASIFLLVLLVFFVSLAGLLDPALEGLDSAHNVMDGVFFSDFFADFPRSATPSYVFDYYRQYPALGFVFWPPFFPFVEGLFFKVFGVSLLVAQVAIFTFSIVFVIFLYLLLRFDYSRLVSVCGVSMAVLVPSLFEFFNSIMREIPVVALMTVVAWMYRYTVSKKENIRSYQAWLILALVSAVALYTKQTACVVLLAVMVDMFVNRRESLRLAQSWVGLGFFVVLVLPLVIFTLTYGKSNLEQSVGENTKLIMQNYQGPRRWSAESWLYYVRAAWHELSAVLLVGVAGGLTAGILVPRFLRRNIFVIAWILIFYLCFSYFDNKSYRFFSLMVVPGVLLSVAFFELLLVKLSIRGVHVAFVVLVVLCAMELAETKNKEPPKVVGVERITEKLDIGNLSGNIAYIGRFRQLFVYFIRLQDRQRRVYVIQGDDTLDADDIERGVRNYRIRYLLIENDGLSAQEMQYIDALKISEHFDYLSSHDFYDGSKNVTMLVFKYLGDLPDEMHVVPLGSSLIQ